MTIKSPIHESESPQQGKTDWQSIDTAPKDGTIIWLRHEDVGEFIMSWDAKGNNALFQPDEYGIWVATDNSITWSEKGGNGPAEWRPYSQEQSQ